MNSTGQRPARAFQFALIAIALVCLAPRLLLGATQFIEYDGYWHIWIAQQDLWANFIREYQSNAHPPLYFLLLRMTFWLGRNNLTYRSISLITGTASVYLVGITALRAVKSPIWGAVAALSYGLALPSILVSNEVRTYMMAAFLVQISFYYFLDLIAAVPPISLRPRIIFAVTAALACLTEYYALIYVGAALLLVLVLPVARREKPLVRGLGRELLTFILILALPVWEYISHFGGAPTAYDHLPTFYFQPEGAESVFDFLLRNLRNEWNCFSPLPIQDGLPFFFLLAVVVVAIAALLWMARAWRMPENTAALAILILPLIMMAAIAAGAVARAYPFGGFLRQQYVLFPFFAICPFMLPDRLLATAPRNVGYALAAVLGIAIVAVSIENYQAWPKQDKLLMTDQMNRYNREFPNAQSIYIDQFNLTTFFMHHHDWHWEFLGPVPGSATVDMYKLTRGNRTMYLFRDRESWNLDLRSAVLYHVMATGMRTDHVTSTTIFGIAQPAGKSRTQSQVAAYRARVDELTAAESLCVQTLDLDNYDVYAEFRAAGTCIVPSPSKP